jgi:hypothetical protein
VNHERIRPEDGPAAPVVVHRATGSGGRRVTISARNAGVAHSDLVEFLRRAGLPDASELLDDPRWVRWQDGRPHEYDTTPPGHTDHGAVIR